MHRLVCDCVLKLFYIVVMVVKAGKEVVGLVVVGRGVEVVEGQRGRK